METLGHVEAAVWVGDTYLPKETDGQQTLGSPMEYFGQRRY